MAEVKVSRPEVQVTLTLNEEEAQYLRAALSFVNPVDALWDKWGGDPIHGSLFDAMVQAGVSLEAAGDFAKVATWVLDRARNTQ